MSAVDDAIARGLVAAGRVEALRGEMDRVMAAVLAEFGEAALSAMAAGSELKALTDHHNRKIRGQA